MSKCDNRCKFDYEEALVYKEKTDKILTFIEVFLYASITVFFICTIRLAINSPLILSAQFNKLNQDYSINKPFRDSELFFSEFGIVYPALGYSFIATLFIGLVLYSFFPKETRLKNVWKNFFIFDFSVFGVLVTLFSIWGA